MKVKITLSLFVCLFLGMGQLLIAQKLSRPVFIQKPGTHQVTLSWVTDTPSQCTMVYYRENFKSQSLEKAELTAATHHELTLTNLVANTKYFYALYAENGLLTEAPSQYFYTAPETGSTPEITLWAMGDFGDFSKQLYVDNQRDVSEAYKAFNPGKTDLWLWLGDHAYCCGTEEQYDRQVFNAFGPNLMNNIAVMPTPGNHEYLATATGQKDRQIPYYDIFALPTLGELGGVASKTEAYYSYNYGNVHLISLDSFGLDEGYRLSDSRSKQYQWLLEDLKANTLPWVIVYFHHPPFSSLSHISDAEPELLDIRRALVPIFDQFQVDLVLNGHSHVYERSFLMKGLTGSALDYKPEVHQVQQTNGNYTASQAPYINKTEGTIYAVAGSAGRLDWNGYDIPLPCNTYYNYKEGGSLVIKVNDNRLDGSWVTGGKEVKDKFTIFKNTQKEQTVNAIYGETVQLKASWPGTYRWSDGRSISRSINYVALTDTVVSVIDSLGYLEDKFYIKVYPQATITTEIARPQTPCMGQDLKVIINWKDVSASDGGTFSLDLINTKNLTLETSKIIAPLTGFTSLELPDYIDPSVPYAVRVRPSDDQIQSKLSASFQVHAPANAIFNNPDVVDYANSFLIDISTTGDLPIQLSINNEAYTMESQDTVLSFTAPYPETFQFTAIQNICGTGTYESRSIRVMAPLGYEEASFKVFPNPSAELIYIDNRQKEHMNLQLINQKGVSVLSQKSNKEEVVVNVKNIPAGLYTLKVQTASKSVNRKIVIY